MRKWAHNVNQFLSGLAGWLMFAMMMLLVADVITRSFDMPLQLMAELSVFVMMIVIYLGFSRCEEHGEHVRLQFAVNALPKRAKSIVASAAQLLAVAVIGLMLYAVTGDAEYALWENGDSYQAENLVDVPGTLAIRKQLWNELRAWMDVAETPFVDNWFAKASPKEISSWNAEQGLGKGNKDREQGKDTVFDLNASKPR